MKEETKAALMIGAFIGVNIGAVADIQILTVFGLSCAIIFLLIWLKEVISSLLLLTVKPAMMLNLWASLGYGLFLLCAPDLFCDLIKADAVNIAWLRTIGAALLGTNVVGSWLWLNNPTLELGRVLTITAGLQAIAMSASLRLGEFTAEKIWIIQASIVLAVLVTIGLSASSTRGFGYLTIDTKELREQIITESVK